MAASLSIVEKTGETRPPHRRTRASTKGELLERYAGQQPDRFVQFDSGFGNDYPPPDESFASLCEHVSELRSQDCAYVRLQIRKGWVKKNDVLRMLDEIRVVVASTDANEFVDEHHGGTEFAERAQEGDDLDILF